MRETGDLCGPKQGGEVHNLNGGDDNNAKDADIADVDEYKMCGGEGMRENVGVTGIREQAKAWRLTDSTETT